MRLLIVHEAGGPSLARRTVPLDLPEAHHTTTHLLNALALRFNRPSTLLLLRFKRDNVWLRVVEGWVLSHYQIETGCTLHLQFLGQEDQSTEVAHKRLRLLALSGPSSFSRIKGECAEIKQQYPVQDDYIDRELQKALILAREGSLEQLQSLLQEVPENSSLEDTASIRAQKEDALLNSLGRSGWGLAHQAAFAGHIKILQFLIAKGCNLNRPSADGWTPLQLAVKHGNSDVLLLILADQSLCLDQITTFGTALHVAARLGQRQCIQILLSFGAKSDIKSDKGELPHQVAANSQCRRLLTRRQQPQRAREEPVQITKGTVFKLMRMTKSMKLRYLVVDPRQNVLLRFENAEEYPYRPKETIKLSEVRGVRGLTPEEVPWYYRKGYFYFEVKTEVKLTFASESKDLATLWVENILKAMEYCRQPERNGDVPCQLFDISQEAKTCARKDPPAEEVVSSKQALLRRVEQFKRSIFPKAKKRAKRRKHIFDGQRCVTQQATTERSSQACTQPPEQVEQSDEDQELEASLETVTSTKVNFSSFKIIKQVGHGAFGKVFLATLINTSQVFALKSLKKKTLILKRQVAYAVTECSVLREVQSPFIVTLHYAFQTPNYLYLALDYCEKGDMSYHLARVGTFTEEVARFYIAELILAVEALHRCNVVYRDLKPQNLLIDKEGHLKLTDFGLSKMGITDDLKTKSFCGTPAYLSPDILSQRGIGKEADLYGIGALLYQFIQGNPPFYAEDLSKLYKNIRQGKITFTKASPVARKIIAGLLERNPKKRLGSANRLDIRNHQFFEGMSWEQMERKELPAPLREVQFQEDEEPQSKVEFTDFEYTEGEAQPNKVIGYSFIRK